jgi:hypothetical protein
MTPPFIVKFVLEEGNSRPEIMIRRRRPVVKKISLESLEASVTAYYDSLTDAEVKEDKLWGEFAGRELAAIYPPCDPG